MKAARELLELLTDRYPPADRCKHGLTLAEDGRLVVHLNFASGWRDIVLDNEDLSREPTEILLAIHDIFEAPLTPAPK